ncbi:ion channel [Deinococcus hohokamensis]|uniref:Ion channel n=1 Tax=Deinococcus hohokamensis TaxID=309883 RepID=A0ABV9I3X4_9DEIO
MSAAPPTGPMESPPVEPIGNDLGLGRVVAQESRQRMLNPDGSFNAQRGGLGFWASLNLYHDLISLSWPMFFGLLALAYLLLNAAFAGAYLAAGPGALSELPADGVGRFWACFFFSVQTFGTIGFGHVYPRSLTADVLVTFEAFVGLLGVALATGMLFARFSRPRHRLLFSRCAVVAPYRGGWGLMFRLVNAQRTQVIEVEAEVTVAYFKQVEEQAVRHFARLKLERDSVTFFPLAWTVVHPIDENSPLWQVTPEGLRAAGTEVMVSIRGLDDAVYDPVRARTSYQADAIRWHTRFSDLYLRRPGHPVSIDVRRLSETEPAG